MTNPKFSQVLNTVIDDYKVLYVDIIGFIFVVGLYSTLLYISIGNLYNKIGWDERSVWLLATGLNIITLYANLVGMRNNIYSYIRETRRYTDEDHPHMV